MPASEGECAAGVKGGVAACKMALVRVWGPGDWPPLWRPVRDPGGIALMAAKNQKPKTNPPSQDLGPLALA